MDTRLIATLLICAFNAVLFGQSGLDKVFNYRDNRDWINGHFAKSIFASFSSLLLIVLTGLELITAVLSVYAIVVSFAGIATGYIQISYILALITLLCLFTGQRIAKDYAGAAGLSGYILISVSGIILLLV
jgi:hypothetical protein